MEKGSRPLEPTCGGSVGPKETPADSEQSRVFQRAEKRSGKRRAKSGSGHAAIPGGSGEGLRPQLSEATHLGRGVVRGRGAMLPAV